ncbi:MAG: trigger factor [Phycisphaerae bacterium]
MATDEVNGNQTDEPGVSVAEEEDDPKEAMKKVISVQVTDADALRRTVSITIPEKHLQFELDKDYDDLVNDALVPGFRKGRAPRRLVEKRFGREVNEQVQTRVVSNAYLAAIEKEDLKVLGDPKVWVEVKDKQAPTEPGQERLLDLTSALRHMKLPEAGDFSFRCEIEVKPEFELPKLEGVPIEKPDLNVTEDDVQVQIDRIRARRGHWQPLEADGRIEEDDLIVCDMKMTVDGTEVKTVDNLPVAARAQVIEGAVVSDLGKKLVGAKLGEKRTVEAQLPDDYEVEAYRGKKAGFELTINEIKRLQLPPLDKAFLAAQGFDSEKEFRDWVRSQMEVRLEQEIRRGMRNRVREHLLENTKLEVPEGLSSRQTERVISRRLVELRRQGVPESEIDKHADALQTSAREQVAAELKLHFILEEIAEKLDIDVTEEEINGQIAAMARAYNRRFDRVRDELAKRDGLMSLYLDIRSEKCIDKILENAAITETKPRKSSSKPSKPAKKAAGTKRRAGSGSKTAAAGESETTEKKVVKKTAKKATRQTEKKAAKKTAKKKPRG